MDWFEDFVYSQILRNTKLDQNDIKSQITKVKFIKRISSILILIMALATFLMLFDNIKSFGISIIASAGFLTVVLGFAAQKHLGSIFTNMQLAFSQPIKIDDVVVVENEWGTIEEINTCYVVIKLWDLRRMLVPINYFIEKSFQNLSHKKKNLIDSVFLYVDYSISLVALRQEIGRFLATSELWDKKVFTLQLTAFKENCIELRIL